MAVQAPARGGGVVGPLFLVSIGVIFLLNNLGLLAWSVWEIMFRLWPVLLIAIGLDLLVRSRWGTGPLATMASLAIVVAVLGLAAAATLFTAPSMTFGQGMNVENVGPWNSNHRVSVGGAIRTETIRQPLEDADRAQVELNFGVGQMKVAAMSESDGLIEGSLILQGDERVSQDFHVRGGTAYYKLRNESTSLLRHDGPFQGSDRQWDLKLNPSVPMKLKVDGGVGKADLDLSRLQLSDLEIKGGINTTTVTLPTKGQMRAEIDGGIGEFTVLVPRGMAARIEVERGLTSVEVAGNFRQSGKVYTSPGYDTARDRAQLSIKGGIGKIRVTESDAL